MQNLYQLGIAHIAPRTSIPVAATNLATGCPAGLALSRHAAIRCSASVSSANGNAKSSAFDFRQYRFTNSPLLNLVKNNVWIGILPSPQQTESRHSYTRHTLPAESNIDG